MNGLKLLEVILYVEDMHSQVCYYREVLGLPVRRPVEHEDYSGEYWVELEAGSCVLALHGGGGRQLGKDAPKLVFAVDDIQEARLTLQDKGVSLSEVRSPAPGVYVCDFVDPEGNHLSIEQHE
jgi:predicted enzyme related to lactoylglutathione lyase